MEPRSSLVSDYSQSLATGMVPAVARFLWMHCSTGKYKRDRSMRNFIPSGTRSVVTRDHSAHLEPQDGFFGPVVEIPRPGNRAGNGRVVLVNGGGSFVSMEDCAGVIQLFRVLRQYVLISLVDGLVDALSALDILEVLHELEGTLSRAQFLKRLFNEGLGHIFNFLDLLPKALHDCVPAVFVLPVENIERDL